MYKIRDILNADGADITVQFQRFNCSSIGFYYLMETCGSQKAIVCFSVIRYSFSKVWMFDQNAEIFKILILVFSPDNLTIHANSPQTQTIVVKHADNTCVQNGKQKLQMTFISTFDWMY